MMRTALALICGLALAVPTAAQEDKDPPKTKKEPVRAVYVVGVTGMT